MSWLRALVVLFALAPASLAVAAPAKTRAVVWLHGHPGGPRSPKIWQLGALLKAEGLRVHAPDMNLGKGGAAGFTVGRAMQQVSALLDREHIDEVVLIGHSMGGLTASRLSAADARVRGLVLLAPALGRTPAENPTVPQAMPVMMFHGAQDSVVPVESSRGFAARRSAAGGRLQLRVLDDDHALRINNDLVVRETADFVKALFPPTRVN